MILHIVNKSPSQSDALDSCIRQAQPNSAILLIEDAIYTLYKIDQLYQKYENLKLIKIYALTADVIARGATQVATEHIERVDYLGFAALTEQYPSSLSWY